MEENIDLLLLDNSNNLIEERNVPKPNTYDELQLVIKNNFIRLPENYQIFYRDEYNIEYIIKNNEDYKLSKDILFINELKNEENIKESMYESNYDKLSESKQNILDEKYNCNICEVDIKEEKPLLCYRCQKLFHKKCLEKWDEKCNEKNIKFSCPKCKYELPLKDWLQKLNYNEERLNEANIMKELTNKNQLNNEIKSEYSIFKLNTYNIYENILNKVDKINSLLEKNEKNKSIIENDINEINPHEIQNKIEEGLDIIEESIKNIHKKYKKDIPIEKLVCKILVEKMNSGEIIKDKAIGFFCETDKTFPIKYALITNNHILDEESIKIGKIIEIEYYTEIGYITKKIEITKKRKVYFDIKLNFTCIEILDSDNIKNYFLIEQEIYQNNMNLLDKDVFMLQYLNNNLSYNYGKILSIEDNLIKHNIPINNNYSGSPLILKSEDTYFIIGLYYGNDIFNFATKFNFILESIRNKVKIVNDDKENIENEIDCVYYEEEDKKTIRLIHDYDYIFNWEDNSKELREPHLQARLINQKFFMHNIELIINGKKMNFDFRYERKNSDPKLIKVKFIFKKLLHNMSFMFSGCSSLISIDLSKVNTSKVNNMSYMFRECDKLLTANFNSFNTSKVVNMKAMFYRCKSLESLDLSSFKTNKVTDMSEMFYGCGALESLNLTSFKVKNVINMSCMFQYCSSLKTLDLSSFNTCCVLNMSYMFCFCNRLTSLDLSYFDTEGANTYKMFFFCNALKKENIRINNKEDKINRIKKFGIK